MVLGRLLVRLVPQALFALQEVKDRNIVSKDRHQTLRAQLALIACLEKHALLQNHLLVLAQLPISTSQIMQNQNAFTARLGSPAPQ